MESVKKKIAISVGDLNGIGIQIILSQHEIISNLCQPIYCINKKMLEQASFLLNIPIPDNFVLHESKGEFKIKPSCVSKKAGLYSYVSFLDAISLSKNKKTHALVTLPINKESWNKAGITYKGHTEVLRDIFGQNAIMMLGCEKMFVSLYTEHMSLKDVIKEIKTKKILTFLLNFYECVKSDNIAVLALNPHASDNGVLGNEEKYIIKAIKKANLILKKEVFKGPLVPDTAFSPSNRANFTYYVAMYHDQGLIPLKALYFDESINISLNLPIKRTSVDHGTAFDIAYKNKKINSKSYINAVKEAIR
ncbi:MAG: 4-hydroxythreonine-4-phosphate dehydrogenase [Campylobacteraceae bacterium]|nr:4-hydroxythreonine-4-phosphate dehydrogenase [Campylobacteraceae bacterium]